jgi:ATP-dependent Clp protease ATP-binding subunit ClpB
MTIEKFTTASQELINSAAEIATKHHNTTLQPLHLLAATLQNEFCLTFFNMIDVPTHELNLLVNRELATLPTSSSGTQLGVDRNTQDFLQACEKEAQSLGDEYISLEHILLALTTTSHLSTAVRNFFKQTNFTHKAVTEQAQKIRKGKKVTDKNAEAQYQVLEKFTQNLTKQAREGKLDPVIGRHEEIRRVIQILSRRTKNNPVLIGEPGVGKTAIIEGIAQRIVAGDVPESLENKQIFSLDLGLLIAGTKFQGEFEERIKNILKAVEEAQDSIVLFIDEIHMLVGAGSSGGGMDASNLLKPALARGTLHCIGATTIKEYKKYIEKDAALERRFQPVFVEEPTPEDALSILRGLKERYELHHGIRIKDQALVSAVTLSDKNIPDRFLPDKAIDLIDEAASMVRMSIDSQPEELDRLERRMNQLEVEKAALKKEKDDTPSKERLKELEKELAEIKEQHKTLYNQWKAETAPLEKINEVKSKIEEANYQYQLAERQGDFAKASEIKYGKLVELEKELSKQQEKLKELKSCLVKQEVDEHDIALVLARWTKIPAEKLQESETDKLLHMEEYMRHNVVGQDDAVAKIAHAIQMHRTGLTDPNRPIGSFLFLGPTGVGKTEVARTLADFLFHDPRKIIRIDMSEYMEKHAVARLIGSPPGYVGYEEGGQLTEQIRRNPYSVVLFDEIEKAHPDVFNIFLQILDEGHLTDGQGRQVSFKNCIIIMTSNIGSHLILAAKTIDEKVREDINKELYRVFKPEFLNRIDAIVFFNSLDEKQIVSIAHIHLEKLIHRLKERHVTLMIDKSVEKFIAEKGYVKEFGARPLKRAIQDYITVPLSQFLLKNPEAREITVNVKNNMIELT